MIVVVCAVLSLILQIGFYVLVALIALCYVGLGALALLMPDGRTASWEDYVLLAVLGAAVASLLRGVVTASRSRAVLPGSVVVSPEQAPGLWFVVREVADRFGIATPMEIRLTSEPNAAVGEEARMLGLLQGKRRLYVGVPLLLGLTTDELRAVLCHEFGHYACGHTRLGAITYRGYAVLADVRRELMEDVRGTPLLFWFGGFLIYGVLGVYGRIYDAVSLAVRRRQEVDADRAAARICGPAVLADALRSADATAAAWADFRARFVEPMERQRVIPNEVFSPFRAMLGDPGYRQVFARHRAQPPENGSWRDLHPAMQRRLDLLAGLPDVPEIAEVDPGELLADPAALFVRVTPPNSRPGRPVAWQTWLEFVAEHDSATAALALPVDPITPEAVLALLEVGSAVQFDVVYAVVGQALVTAGTARWNVPWTGSRALVNAEGIAELVRTAIREPEAVGWLRNTLKAAGADLTQAIAQREKPKGLLDIAYGDST